MIAGATLDGATPQPIPGAFSILDRADDGIATKVCIRARPGHAHTLWYAMVVQLQTSYSAEAEARLVRMDEVEVRRSPRARRWRLEVPWGERARLTVPQRTSRSEVERLLAEKRSWIEEQRRRQVPRLGLERLTVSESEARIATRELVTVLAEEEAERVGVAYQRIRIGGQRTLWGSCSARGTLSFNWRLVLAPPEVLDYVVVHELCHLRVPDHSLRFWALVARHRPHWRDQRDWLRRHGPELLAFRPSSTSTRSPRAP